jgi:Bacteriocin-protection, YdeI or OmpD-Associated
MSKKEMVTGVVHSVPEDLQKTLVADRIALELWRNITPLARNEWICWVEDAKKPETRHSRIRGCARNSKKESVDLAAGMVALTEERKASVPDLSIRLSRM